MLYIKESGKIYGIEILEIDTDLVTDMTYGGDSHQDLTITRASVVIWFDPDKRNDGELMRARRRHITVAANGNNVLGEIESHIRATIISEGL